ncbi:unnamed protein product [Allacma fusca]|uniref:Cytochrome P450 n=1 Tax=Allacma fusca TaxID=39272 RepID=A0A8J2NIP6_9HEXA|nr:unnamed protein product [Allacma fusca]
MKEIDKRQEDGEGDRTFYTDEQLITVGMDLFMTGSDTTSTALEFALLFMLRFPHVQAKVQEEIDSVIGRDRLPNIADKISMPYTEATTWEIMRCTCLVPIAIRTALRDGLQINGVTLKKETMVGINLVSIHYSEELWEDPQSFRPERFLNEKMELVNLHKIIPFGFGKRACIGDWMAKSTFFTFFVTCLQNFTFEKVPWLPEPSTKTYSGIAQYPMQFSALVKERF